MSWLILVVREGAGRDAPEGVSEEPCLNVIPGVRNGLRTVYLIAFEVDLIVGEYDSS